MRAWVLAALTLGLGSAQAAAPRKNVLWTEASSRKARAQLPDFGKVARSAMKAVVAISVSEAQTPEAAREETSKGVGSGFIIHEDGYILTSSHVVETAGQIEVSVLGADGEPRPYRASVVGEDPQSDFALLKIEAERKLPVLKLGSATTVDVADWLLVIGNPFGLAHSVSVGVVSYKGRTDVTPTGRSGYFDYIQTDASINPGSSGGPVLDLNGDVIAIANAVNVAGQGIGFAVPIDNAKEVVPQLLAYGHVRRGWIGISVKDLEPALAERLGQPGVIVSEVLDNSPAQKAGIQVGDVILGLNDVPMRHAQLLRWKVATAGVGNSVRLRLERRGQKKSLKIHLQEAPPAVSEAVLAESRPQVLDFGAAISEVDTDAAAKAGLAAPFGALVHEVQAGSAVAKAGLQPGDVVLKVNTAEVASQDEFVRNVRQVPAGGVVRLFVRRAGRTLFLAFRK
jgi:serine protease Do